MTSFSLPRRGVLALGGAALLPAAAAAQADTLAAVRAAGVIRIGQGGAFPPFGFMENGQPRGLDIDLGNEIGRRMGVRVEWQIIAFAGIIAALTSGRVDALVTAMTWTEDRASRILFSEPYYRTGIAAAHRPGLTLQRPEDLAGRIVGVQVGTSGERFVRDGFGSAVREIRSYNEFPLAMRDLEIGRVEAVVNTAPVLRWNLSRSNRANLGLSPVWDARDVGINTRQADAALMAEINRHLSAMRAEGMLAEMDRRWFGPPA